MRDLSTVTIEELVEELEGRFDSLIVGGVRPPKKMGERRYDIFVRQSGHYLLCIGLASVISQKVIATVMDSAEDLDPADL